MSNQQNQLNQQTNFNLNINNEQDVILFFQQLSTETNPDKRKLLEAQVMQLEVQLIPLIEVLWKILNTKAQSSSLSIILFIKNSINKSNDLKTSKDKEYNINIIKAFLPIFKQSGYYAKNISDNICEIFSSILKNPHIASDTTIQSELFNHMVSDLNSNHSVENSLSVFNIVFTLLNANITNSCFLALIEKSKHTLDFIMLCVNEHLKNITKIDNENDIAQYTKIISLKRNFFELLFLISMKLKKQNKLVDETKDSLLNSYLNYAYETIIYESQNSSFMSFTQNKDIDCSINSLKAKAFMWISMLIQYDGTEEVSHPDLIEKGKNLFGVINEGFKYIIKNHIDYLQNMDSDDSSKYNDYEYSNIIFQANLFLSRILIRKPFINTMINRIKE